LAEYLIELCGWAAALVRSFAVPLAGQAILNIVL
jgi:hypothetical protein